MLEFQVWQQRLPCLWSHSLVCKRFPRGTPWLPSGLLQPGPTELRDSLCPPSRRGKETCMGGQGGEGRQPGAEAWVNGALQVSQPAHLYPTGPRPAGRPCLGLGTGCFVLSSVEQTANWCCYWLDGGAGRSQTKLVTTAWWVRAVSRDQGCFLVTVSNCQVQMQAWQVRFSRSPKWVMLPLFLDFDCPAKRHP